MASTGSWSRWGASGLPRRITMRADDQRPRADGGVAPTGGGPAAGTAKMAAVRDRFFEFFQNRRETVCAEGKTIFKGR